MEQKKIFRTALYTRVSTVEQNSELQLRELQSHADREGWQIVDTYQDIISGAKAIGRD
jgi:DNA invertase Pin-like site-specific DNA recombinase